MTLNEALQYALMNLHSSVEFPDRDAKYILREIFQIDEMDFILRGDAALDNEKLLLFKTAIIERQRGVPLEYIFHLAHFMGRDFYVNQHVLIPRQDTERSVEVILNLIDEFDYKNMLEIGTGSGCVSITISCEREIEVDGIDISEDALSIAKYNQQMYDCNNLHFFQSNLFDTVHHKYDVIYSNPPYIPTDEIPTLMKSVREFEPVLALDGGKDGLQFYREIISQGREYLNEDGFLVFEIGYDQKDSVHALFEQYQYIDVRVKEDYSHLPRVVYARYKR